MLLLLAALTAAFLPATALPAMSYADYQFKLAEAQRQKAKASERLEVLSAQREVMLDEATPVKERQQYSAELIDLIQYLEKLDADIEALQAELPKIRFAPVLKLVAIGPAGAPGASSTRAQSHGMGDQELWSIRFTEFPLELTAGQPFRVAADVVFRKHFPAEHPCFDPAMLVGDPVDPQAFLSVFTRIGSTVSLPEGDVPRMTSGFHGQKHLTALCTDAPTDRDPDSGDLKQAEFEKDARLHFAARFVPAAQERDEDGFVSYRYRLETTTDRTIMAQQLEGILIKETSATSGRGNCLDPGGHRCNTVFVTISAGPNLVTLTYRQVADGETYLAEAPDYQHPAAFETPPLVGSIKLAVDVPDVRGMYFLNAEDALERAGLKTNVAFTSDPPTPGQVGMVHDTQPAAGARVRPNTTVSLSAYDLMLYVPDVIGMTRQEAIDRIERAGLLTEVRSGDAPPASKLAARVASQDPAADAGVFTGATVVITIYGAWQPPRLTCEQQYPGSYDSGVPNDVGGTKCECLAGKLWDANQQACVDPPRVTCEQQYPGSYDTGVPVAGSGTKCECMAGKLWDANQQACVDPPRVTCEQQYPGSYDTGVPVAGGGTKCECMAGKLWDANQQACVDPPRTAGSSESFCNHPWKEPGGTTTVMGIQLANCKCRFGTDIAYACLPPGPVGADGCPPYTHSEYTDPSHLGRGCKCSYGYEDGACKTP